MALLKNTWIGYITRSYEQIKSDLLTKFQNQIPEMTDHTETNIFVRILSIWAAITEQLGYYIDQKGQEVYLSTCRLYASAVKIAKLLDYRIKGYSAASVDIKFYTNILAPSNIIIPVGTEVRTAEGIRFFTLANGTIVTGSNNVTIGAKQQIAVIGAALGTTDNTNNQIFIVDDFVVDSSLNLTIGSDTYLFVETLAYASRTDKVFTQSVNEAGKIYIELGDGVNGYKPTAAQAVVLNYAYTEGINGNVAENTINTIASSVTVPMGVTLFSTNINRASGGANRESLADLKVRIPLSFRTLNRSVNIQDHIDIAMLCPGVAKAATDFKCGKDIPIYIAPVGGGFPSGTLLTQVKAWFEKKRMVTTTITPKGAGEARVKISAKVKILANYNNTIETSNIRDRLISFFSVENQDIKGTLDIGNVYQVIEDTPSVDVSEITVLHVQPFASPIYNTTAVLDWDRDLNPASADTLHWVIKMLNSTTYQLFKENSVLGTYTTGSTIVLPEITFTINGTYTTGDVWGFNTYNYFGSTVLDELSILTSFTGDINLTVTGGI